MQEKFKITDAGAEYRESLSMIPDDLDPTIDGTDRLDKIKQDIDNQSRNDMVEYRVLNTLYKPNTLDTIVERLKKFKTLNITEDEIKSALKRLFEAEYVQLE